jgi:hypothetical protein
VNSKVKKATQSKDVVGVNLPKVIHWQAKALTIIGSRREVVKNMLSGWDRSSCHRTLLLQVVPNSKMRLKRDESDIRPVFGLEAGRPDKTSRIALRQIEYKLLKEAGIF